LNICFLFVTETLDITSGEKESIGGSRNESFANERQSSQIIFTDVQELNDDTGARRTQVNGVFTHCRNTASESKLFTLNIKFIITDSTDNSSYLILSLNQNQIKH
jgi:hypothetical protein